MAKDNGGSVADTGAYLEIDPRLVETAVHYYSAFRNEIDDWIERVNALNEREESTRRAAPGSDLCCCSTSTSPRDRPTSA